MAVKMIRIKQTTITILLLFIGLNLTIAQKNDKTILFNNDSKNINAICFANDGKQLAVADNQNIKVFTVSNQKLASEFSNGHTQKILSVDISKDNLLMVTAGLDSTIIVWDFANQKILKKLAYHHAIINAVQFSPDGRYLASGGSDHNASIYDLEDDKLIATLTDHTLDITSIDFSSDGNLLATAAGDKTIAVYQVPTFDLVTTLRAHNDWVRNVRFSPDASRLVSCGDDKMAIIWKVSSQVFTQIDQHKIMGGWLLSVDYFNDNKTIAYAGSDGKATIVGPMGTYKIKAHHTINQLSFLIDGDIYLKVALATEGGGVMIFDARNLELEK
jgi:WD40 repeat protein